MIEGCVCLVMVLSSQGIYAAVAAATPGVGAAVEDTDVPLVCNVCGKQIIGRNKKQRLQYHLLTHSGEKTHQCPYCDYKALLKFTLNRHIRGVHKDLFSNSAELLDGNPALIMRRHSSAQQQGHNLDGRSLNFCSNTSERNHHESLNIPLAPVPSLTSDNTGNSRSTRGHIHSVTSHDNRSCSSSSNTATNSDRSVSSSSQLSNTVAARNLVYTSQSLTDATRHASAPTHFLQ